MIIIPLIRPSVSNVKARSGGQPGHSKVVARGILPQLLLRCDFGTEGVVCLWFAAKPI